MALIRGISVDLDGCFLGHSFLTNAQHDVVEANIRLLTKLRDTSSDYKFTKLFVGSNRQSVEDDKANDHFNQNGSGYPRVVNIASFIGAEVDPFLMADLYNDLPDGTALNQALKNLDADCWTYDPDKYKQSSFPEWLHDKSKLTILYAQIHKLASENPTDDIEFSFYDDNAEILMGLRDFFQRYPVLLPNNVSLVLIRYEGPSSEDVIENIKGAGNIDFSYRETVKLMAGKCIESERFQDIYPTSKDGQPVRNYQDAKATQFLLTQVLDGVRDYTPTIVQESTSSSSTTHFARIRPSSTREKRQLLGSHKPVQESTMPTTESLSPRTVSASWPPTLFVHREQQASTSSSPSLGNHRSVCTFKDGDLC